MKVAIMQPYLFPFIGYFQLIQATDIFVFLDDVNFIKKGWINRNKILINNSEWIFSIPLKSSSQNKHINEIETVIDNKWKIQFYRTLELNYKRAPNYESTYHLIQSIFNSDYKTISELAIQSIKHVSNYLELKIDFQISSVEHGETQGIEKSTRLIEITRRCNGDHYINSYGGINLYDKTIFEKNGVKLSFLKNECLPYKQFNDNFIGGLSIIDVLMFNNKQSLLSVLKNYKLV